MKFIILLLFSSFIVVSSNNHESAKQTNEVLPRAITNKASAPEQLLRHVVLFNFNETATDETVSKIEQAFADLKNKISEIHDFEWGTNNSPEGLNKDFTHCFLVTFLSEKDRDAYLPHPAHKEFVEMIGSYIEDVTVIDYWAE